MNDANGPYPGGYNPGPSGPPPQPHGGYPPPPHYPPYPPRRSNAGLLIALIALLLVIIVGAVLYFTGAFGGRSSVSQEAVALTRENVIGIWSSEEDCGSHQTDYQSDGVYYQQNTADDVPKARWGEWRLEGNRLHLTTNTSSGYRGPAQYLQIDRLTADTMEVTYPSGSKYRRVRCTP